MIKIKRGGKHKKPRNYMLAFQISKKITLITKLNISMGERSAGNVFIFF
jgi:hypothetical protein